MGINKKQSPNNKNGVNTKQQQEKQKITPQKQIQKQVNDKENQKQEKNNKQKNSNYSSQVKFIDAANIHYFKQKKMTNYQQYWKFIFQNAKKVDMDVNKIQKAIIQKFQNFFEDNIKFLSQKQKIVEFSKLQKNLYKYLLNEDNFNNQIDLQLQKSFIGIYLSVLFNQSLDVLENQKNDNNQNIFQLVKSSFQLEFQEYLKILKDFVLQVSKDKHINLFYEHLVQCILQNLTNCPEEVLQIWTKAVFEWFTQFFDKNNQQSAKLSLIHEVIQEQIYQTIIGLKQNNPLYKQLVEVFDQIGGQLKKKGKKQQQNDDSDKQSGKRKLRNNEKANQQEQQTSKVNGQGKKNQEENKKQEKTMIKRKQDKVNAKDKQKVEQINSLYGFNIDEDENSEEDESFNDDKQDVDEDEDDDEEDDQDDDDDDVQEGNEDDEQDQNDAELDDEELEGQIDDEDLDEIDENYRVDEFGNEYEKLDLTGLDEEQINQIMRERDHDWAVETINNLEIENIDEFQLYKYDVDIEGMVFDDIIKSKQNKEILEQILGQLPQYLHLDDDQKKKYFKDLNAKYQKNIQEEKGKLEHTHKKGVKFNIQEIQIKEFDKNQDTKQIKKTPIKFPNKKQKK